MMLCILYLSARISQMTREANEHISLTNWRANSTKSKYFEGQLNEKLLSKTYLIDDFPQKSTSNTQEMAA